MHGNTLILPIITGCAILLLIVAYFIWQQPAPAPTKIVFQPPIQATSTLSDPEPAPTNIAIDVATTTEEPTFTRPEVPEGAIQQESGGLVREGCEDIINPTLANKCKQERVLANYIYSIAPGAIITKGFCVPGTSFDDEQNWNQCTDLSDFKTNTVHEIKNIFEKILQHCAQYGISDCGIVITGGSEFGHKGEEVRPDGTIACIDPLSHCGGKKIDLRLTAGLQSLVELTFEPIEIRDFDGAMQWRDPENGNVYALEPTHWDILVP